jgi:hypothetical protein
MGQAMYGKPLMIHQALADHDPLKILELRRSGEKANQLDSNGRSPLQYLEQMDGLSPSRRTGLHHALLRSLNPMAPAGHAKWEAGHGSPWGLEILLAGALKGGLNDAKGGSQSLNGKVFFSDRTPSTDQAETTRATLRKKARTYAKGAGIKESTPAIRALTHRWLQALNRHIALGEALPASGMPVTLNLQSSESPAAVVGDWLRHVLLRTASGFVRLPEDVDDQMLAEMHLASRLDLKTAGTNEVQSVEGPPLQQLYAQAISNALTTLETGKAPYLALLNSGKVVPLVFGFSHINALKTHTIETFAGRRVHYSYQDEDHALAGSANGGRLLEIEARDVQDLATLALGMRIKGASLPVGTNTTIRLCASRNSQSYNKEGKATYLSAEHFGDFCTKLDQWLDTQPLKGELFEQPLAHLQALNNALRAAPLHAWVDGATDKVAS